MSTLPLFIGLMSGTSLDGVDAVLLELVTDAPHLQLHVLGASHQAFSPELRTELLSLQSASANELHREALAANALARTYAAAVQQTLDAAHIAPAQVTAIGMHGQTIRHRPELGFTRQIGNAALLAELSKIDVVADFRNRDIAAGGQGAPLVPAFHHAAFAAPGKTRVLANIGGIANISVLHADGSIIGFDTGPGNVLLDSWCNQHLRTAYDDGGKWGASGKCIAPLFDRLIAEPFFALPAPKSTGRDLFNPTWLKQKLSGFGSLRPVDVQATLTQLTAASLVAAIAQSAPHTSEVVICGGGAYNAHLLTSIELALSARAMHASVATTDALGIPPNQVEAIAFAWLAQQFTLRQPGNLPAVTGAAGPRILGALYPA